MAKLLIAATLAAMFGVGAAFWYYEGLAPEARTSLRQKLGLPVSAQEALQVEVYARLSTLGRASISNARMMENGDLCGQASVAASNETAAPRLERFILSPGKFFEFGGKGIEALGDPNWQKLALVTPMAVAMMGGPVADAHRYLLHKHWELFCGEVLPTAETAADLRNALKNTLKDPASATFRNDRVTDRGYCGELNAKNGFGGLAGFTRFYLLRNELWQAEGSAPIPLKAGGVWNTSPATELFRSGKATPAQIQGFFNHVWKEVCEG